MNILAGVARMFTSAGRAAFTPFTFLFNMAKTGLDVLKNLAHGNITGAFGAAVKGTIGNAVNAGLNLVEGGNPLLAFAHGTISGKVGMLGA